LVGSPRQPRGTMMFDKLKLNLKVGAALAAAGALLVTAG
jgi:hypothetical protein